MIGPSGLNFGEIPDDREDFGEQITRRKVLMEYLRRNRPARAFVPNWGQEKAFLPFKDYEGEYPNSEKPEIVVFTGGNGVGKTTMMVNTLVGCVWGAEELHPFFADWKIFHELKRVREVEKRALRFRIVCDKGGMEPGGAILEAILQWWPKGLYKLEKNHASFYSQIECYDHSGEDKQVIAQIQVKTFHQDPVAHAGSTLDGVFTDEPMPRELYAETIGRLRTKGRGFLAMFCTPLEVGGWIKDYLEKEADGKRIVFTSASIWDNCADWHPNEELRGKTRGHLPRKTIEFQIREWKKDGPEIARAREFGEFIHLAGAVFKEFNPKVHVVDPYKIPREWPVYCTMDPHDGKPSFITWGAQSPTGDLVIFAEYPYDQEWERVQGGGSVAATCNAIRRIENPFRRQVMYRNGDPGKLLMTYSNTGCNLQQEYAREGFRFALADNSVEVGISRMRELLAWDPHPDNLDSPINVPRLTIMSHNPYTGTPNRNTIQAMSNLTYKRGASASDSTKAMGKLISDLWKDPVDTLRYKVMSLRPYRPVSSFGSVMESLRDGRVFIKRSARPWD